ncbi:hypothetical protein PHET_07992 [Paragonimus heterotremus]|uniref:Uncharacterized protein n=1 Tax=Paragonimus heterotremus TaxID=100268 RepID=A0A8J4SM77_9TREM|nr:hypothetical protein PHET_07992 [Paragonimus heterotremus]
MEILLTILRQNDVITVTKLHDYYCELTLSCTNCQNGLKCQITDVAVRIAPPPHSSISRSTDERVGEADGHSVAPYNRSEMADHTKHRGHCARNCSHRAMRKSSIRIEQSEQTETLVNKPSEEADGAYGMWRNLMRTAEML